MKELQPQLKPEDKELKEFYIDYQPWISLIYVVIFAGPVVGFLFCN